MVCASNPCSSSAWHVLQFSDALDLEFASALSEFCPVTLWRPVRQLLPFWPSRVAEGPLASDYPQLQWREFPVQRGFSRAPLRDLIPFAPALVNRMLSAASNPETSVLVCTAPFFAPVAELWPGPVVYWLSDLIAHYAVAPKSRIRALDRRMCRTARLVCPNSERIAAYLREEALCPPERCVVMPNATGTRSLLAAPLQHPLPVPADVGCAGARPLAGVIGNLAENTDWLFLEKVIRETKWLSWLFVGPVHWPVHDRAQRAARAAILRHPRACFTGPKPYTDLAAYARALDVAVLPYRLREPTFSGSSTRFYDHLAASQPILATNNVAELQQHQPLLKLVHSAGEAVEALDQLRADCFQDGLREDRWRASRYHTWRERAQLMRRELARRSDCELGFVA